MVIAGVVFLALISIAAGHNSFECIGPGFIITEYSGVQIWTENFEPLNEVHDIQVSDIHGIIRITGTQVSRRTVIMLAPPWWFLVLACPFGLVAAAMIYQMHRSSKWVTQGRCGTCGYDLRGTPHRCPECGTIVAAKP